MNTVDRTHYIYYQTKLALYSNMQLNDVVLNINEYLIIQYK